MDDFILVLVFVLVHILLDFYLQPMGWIESKNKWHFRSGYLYLHAMVHGLAVGVAISLLLDNWLHAAMGFLSVSISHAVIDGFKALKWPQSLSAFILDQCLHLFILIAIAAAVKGLDVTNLEILQQHVLMSEMLWMTCLAYLLVLRPTSIVVAMVLRSRSEELESENIDSLRNTGKLIGHFERILILTFILIDQYAAIGFLIAAKSIYRFGDLTKSTDRKLTEYVMLGSFASFTVTLVIGLVFLRLLPQCF